MKAELKADSFPQPELRSGTSGGSKQASNVSSSGVLAQLDDVCSSEANKYFISHKAAMSSVQYLREFVIERLNAAAEEIFGVFETTILEYEEEIDRQRRLLDIVWKPEIKLHRIGE